MYRAMFANTDMLPQIINISYAIREGIIIMGTYVEELSLGVIVRCYLCYGLVRESIYRHQCDVRLNDGICPGYCFSCMIGRGVCKRCEESYSKFFTAQSVVSSYRTPTRRSPKGRKRSSKKKVFNVQDRIIMIERPPVTKVTVNEKRRRDSPKRLLSMITAYFASK